MRLVKATVKRESAPGHSEMHLNVELAPMGTVVFGSIAVWLGFRLWKTLRRRWWLPVGAGLIVLASKGISRLDWERIAGKEEK